MTKKLSIFNNLFLLGLFASVGILVLFLGSEKEVYFKSPKALKVHLAIQDEPFFLDESFRQEFISHLIEVSENYHFDPLLILAVMKVESSFRPDVISKAGALGLMQIKTIAAKEVSKVFNSEIYTARQLLNPFVNVKVGIQYLSFLRKKVGGNMSRILAAYNLGPYHVKRQGILESQYAKKVLSVYQSLTEKFSKAS